MKNKNKLVLKNKRILKNNAIGGYIYDKTQNKWKWGLFGKQSGGTKIPWDIQLNILKYLSCNDFYKILLELKIDDKDLYNSFFNDTYFFKRLGSCTRQWRNILRRYKPHTSEQNHGIIALIKGESVWCKINIDNCEYVYILGKVRDDWFPFQYVSLRERGYSNEETSMGAVRYALL